MLQVYLDCKCLGDNSTDNREVTEGVCESNFCTEGIISAILFFLSMVALFMNSSIDMSLMIRYVRSRQDTSTHRIYQARYIGLSQSGKMSAIPLYLWQITSSYADL